MILLLKLRIRESAFSIAPRLVVQTSGVRLCKFPLAHTHPYFISVRHSCIYPMFLLAVLFVLQGKRKMTPIIPALTALTHNIVWLTPCFLLLSQRVKTNKPDLIKQEIQLRCGVTSVGNRFYIVWLEPSNDNSYVRYTSTPPCFTPQR